MPLPDLSRLLHHPIPSDGAADFHALPDLSLLLRHPIPPDGAADFSALIRPRVGAGPSMNLPGPQLPLQNHQPLPSDPQLPLWSPPDTSTQRAPPSIRPAPPHHFSGAGGSPIDDPDGDLDDDLHADENDLFSAPLGNALGMLGGGDADMDDDEGMELDPSRRRVISLDSPPSGKRTFCDLGATQFALSTEPRNTDDLLTGLEIISPDDIAAEFAALEELKRTEEVQSINEVEVLVGNAFDFDELDPVGSG
ncbi:hypothetical protein DFJ58DRAFT_744749 [Suillus subalutaceus]|uniref:uncharacterized protein n=1 Tax=Suillus subalutaceus TaxID=48586 RepID=UPI001B86C729|nr:uncharacterized protein DFJ58DRAFT_744749 [Suillus subalutaceus]KAG1858981.1 hypothetical protein DFJ58DRAFT_744749 [Suillus subalutaceus]